MGILNYEEKLAKFFQNAKDIYKEINVSYEEKLKAFLQKLQLNIKYIEKSKKR